MAKAPEGAEPSGSAGPGGAASDNFRTFLVGLATDPGLLGRFIKDPSAVMDEAELGASDQAVLQSANPVAINARLSGAPQPGTPVTVLVVTVGQGAPGAETLHVTPAVQALPQVTPVAVQQVLPQVLPVIQQVQPQVVQPQILPQQIFPQILPQVVQPQVIAQQQFRLPGQ